MLRQESSAGNIEGLSLVSSEFCLAVPLPNILLTAKPDELVRSTERLTLTGTRPCRQDCKRPTCIQCFPLLSQEHRAWNVLLEASGLKHHQEPLRHHNRPCVVAMPDGATRPIGCNAVFAS